MRRFRPTIGALQMAISVLHLVVGAVQFRKPLAAIARAGVVDAVDRDPDRQLAAWFMLFGASNLAGGQVTRWAERQTGTLPASSGWTMLALAATGAALMPRSGFWIVIPQALLALGVARRGAARRGIPATVAEPGGG